ncbi:hypothetical protein DFH27DRAFT_563652 [Peziza echinospora]|nr:hypothetical protein DFH27DRAFT_563652 [Peziza echinospora]
MPSIRTPLLKKEGYDYGPYRPKGQFRQCSQLLAIFCGMLITFLVVPLIVIQHMTVEAPGVTRRVAIIGAGASGASTAYYLAKAGPGGSHLNKLEITVFEKSPKVGGRCYAVEVPGLNGMGLPMQVEVGAPGYNKASDSVTSAIVEQIGMGELIVPGGQWGEKNGDYDLGIFDGSKFLFRQPHNPTSWWYWWTSVAYFTRYGWAHRNLQTVGKQLLPQFLGFKNALQSPGSWLRQSPSARYTFPTMLRESMAANAWGFFEGKNVKRPFTTEQIQARTRARYGTNLGLLSGLQAMSAMSDAENEYQTNVAVTGGLGTVFEGMLKLTPAGQNTNLSLLLDSKVLGLRKNEVNNGEPRGWTVAFSTPEPGRSEPMLGMLEFDEVVVAGPWRAIVDGMNFQPAERAPDDSTSWEQVHVTVFTSKLRLEPRAFGLGKDDFAGMPNRVLSTLDEGEQGRLGRSSGKAGVGRAGWWTVENVGTVVRNVERDTTRQKEFSGEEPRVEDVYTEYVYKIVSPAKMEDGNIARLLEWDRNYEKVSWIYRHFVSACRIRNSKRGIDS